jgi:hypothetical protein
MGSWPLAGASRYHDLGFVQVTPGASPNVKTGWTQLIASVPFDLGGVVLQILVETLNRDVLVDLGVGSAGNEQPILSNLAAFSSSAFSTAQYIFPVLVRAGDRLAIRAQSNPNSTTVDVQAQGWGQTAGAEPYQRVVTWGADTSDSGGTSVDPGAVANTLGAWSQLVAATTFDVCAIMVGLQNQRNNARTSGSWRVNVGVGSAGNEQVLIPDLYVGVHATPDFPCIGSIGPLPVSIPAGSRVAVQAMTGITDATDRLFDAVIYGMG